MTEEKIRKDERDKVEAEAEARVNNFIVNKDGYDDTLKERINTLISGCVELKFLVGFFYFSGWQELYQSLKADKHIKLKLLVGLQIDKLMSGFVIEHDHIEEGSTHDDQFSRLLTSFNYAINHEEMDTEGFYNQVHFFVEMLVQGRLIIRKTENPNHAKLYLFRLEEERAKFQRKEGVFITGSSNLTKAGLSGQEEFNVEITDYGYPEAEKYFDKLWANAILITEDDERKSRLIKFIKHQSQAAIVTPFEAYTLILKTYFDLHQQKLIKPEVERLLEEVGFKKFSYQLHAVNQALNIIEGYNGVIIADVVGLGKSVIAALIAKNIGKRGMVICPPGLIGDKGLRTGWKGYVEDFKLYDWEVESRGKLEDLAKGIQGRDIEVIIVDEAHYFRNQDTAAYQALLQICRSRQVILLTATPFNNAPSDIFSLLKLFLVPGKSGITISDNLEGVFSGYNSRFKKLSFITKHYNSTKPEKMKKAEKLYVEIIGEALPIDIDKVNAATSRLAAEIKGDIQNVMIRRNRLDLQSDYEYSNEVGELSVVKDPVELFFYLNDAQADFYDKIIGQYFGDSGEFTGAIYQPFTYEKDVNEDDDLNESENRSLQQQKNLYGFMRRLLVKRFESSFGAFSKSIDSFVKVHKLVRKFIDETGGRYILDRNLVEKLQSNSYDEEEIDEILNDYENQLGKFAKKKTPKNTTVYQVNNFKYKDEFLADIEGDIALLERLQRDIKALKLVEIDPKRETVLAKVQEVISKAETPTRKVIIFSEYVDTVKHLAKHFREKLGNRVLVCEGKISKELAKELDQNFNAQHKGTQTDNFDVLITSDKLAEGFNLNRAGVIINYDIPWNPTKVIQRVGRINRIGTKVFDELYIYNFFPSEAGSDVVKSREIAAQKMFMIHNALGEDSKIFDIDETPTAAGFFEKVNQSPDDDDELDISTQIRNKYHKIAVEYPDIIKRISELPTRVKSAKAYATDEVNVLRRKGLSLFAQQITEPNADKNKVHTILFQDLLTSVECEIDTARLELSAHFWTGYEAIKSHRPVIKAGRSDISNASKAHDNLKLAIKHIDPTENKLREFMETLVKDIKNYHTLSTYTLRQLAQNKPTKSKLKPFLEEVRQIRNGLGEDYLDRLLKRVEGQNVEVIISVENQGLE